MALLNHYVILLFSVIMNDYHEKYILKFHCQYCLKVIK